LKKDRYKETIEVYEKLGEKYIQDVAGVTPYGFNEFVETLPKNALVLDVGCAGGRDSKRLTERGFNVIGIDLVDEFLEHAQADVPGADFYKMDLLELDFPSNSFDAIWACAVLLHIKKKDISKALAGFHKVLKRNGKLCIAVKEGRGVEYKIDKLSDGQKRMFTYFSESELRKSLEKSGFKISFSKIFSDPLGRQDVKWIVVIVEK
jgi:ubiquinone/menaquinone biosynthesis C-methylase UbiE